MLLSFRDAADAAVIAFAALLMPRYADAAAIAARLFSMPMPPARRC